MSMRLEAAIRGDLEKMVAADWRRGGRAARGGLRRAAKGLRKGLREDAKRAKLGRLGRVWRYRVYRGRRSPMDTAASASGPSGPTMAQSTRPMHITPNWVTTTGHASRQVASSSVLISAGRHDTAQLQRRAPFLPESSGCG